MPDFRIKICGVRSEADVIACATAGADCVGLNFYSASIRYLKPNSQIAKSINEQAIRAGLVRVGLFVNEDASQVIEISKAFGLDAVQLHGDESIEMAQVLRNEGTPIIRAIRLPTTPLTPTEIQTAIGPWADLDVTLLLDADAGAEFGGAGRQLDWPSLAAWNKHFSSPEEQPNWILAGGLSSENVSTACRVSTANRVDVASGVEISRGMKSIELIRKFVTQYRARGVDEPQ